MPRQFKTDGQINEEAFISEQGTIAGDGVTFERADRRDPTDVPIYEQQTLTTSDGRNVRDLVTQGWTIGFDNNEQQSLKAFGYDVLQKDEGMGMRVVKKADGTLRTNLDTVMLMIPPAAKLQHDQKEKEDAAEYLAAGEEDGPGFPGQFDERRLSKAGTKRQSEQNRASGMIDSTHGMTLQEGLQKFSPRDREEMMYRYRHGTRHESMDERRAAQADIHRQNAERGGGRKSFAMGAGFDENGRIVR